MTQTKEQKIAFARAQAGLIGCYEWEIEEYIKEIEMEYKEGDDGKKA